jgi:hypothetical protein
MPENTKQTIKFGEGNTVGFLTPLIFFDCIYDTDVGLIELIRREYRDSSMFNLESLDSFENRRQLIKFLYLRDQPNPILPFMNNKNDIETADDLYNQFMSKEYSNILDLCVRTDLYNALLLFVNAEEIRATVFCKNDLERYLLESDPDLSDLEIIDSVDLNNKINSFEQFYFKSIYDQTQLNIYNIIRHKVIYYMDYRFNLDDKNNIKDSKQTVAASVARCRLNTISTYNIDKLDGKEII